MGRYAAMRYIPVSIIVNKNRLVSDQLLSFDGSAEKKTRNRIIEAINPLYDRAQISAHMVLTAKASRGRAEEGNLHARGEKCDAEADFNLCSGFELPNDRLGQDDHDQIRDDVHK